MALKGRQERTDSECADNLMRIEPHEKAYVHDGHQDIVTPYLGIMGSRIDMPTH